MTIIDEPLLAPLDLAPDSLADLAHTVPLGETAIQILTNAVHIVTGDTTTAPRPGQALLAEDIAAAFEVTRKHDGNIGGRHLGEAPTGVGKSLGYLSVASAAAARGERTLVSTEMIGLQSQLIDKDLPVAVEACEQATGYRPTFAVHKGWSNFVCLQAATNTYENPTAAGTHLDPVNVSALASWALSEESNDEPGAGDKDHCPMPFTPAEWATVSVSSEDCIGTKCPFHEACLPGRARERAAESDIVVSNHHLLGVQAAKGVPVVIGNRNLGEFDHLVVDEAHALPGIVRSHGSAEVSERTLAQAARALGWLLADEHPDLISMTKDAEAIGRTLTLALESMWHERPRGRDDYRLTASQNPVEDIEYAVESWLGKARGIVKRHSGKDTPEKVLLAIKRINARLDGLAEAMKLVSGLNDTPSGDGDEDTPGGSARWVEMVTPFVKKGAKAAEAADYPAVKYAPVDVAPAIRFNLMSAPVAEEEGEKSEEAGDDLSQEGEGAPERKHLTAVMLSATLPSGFGRQVGMKGQPVEYASPFDDAYGDSVLYVPKVADVIDPAVVKRLSSKFAGPGGKPKFDVEAHIDWAIEEMTALVTANGGSALILSATARAGRKYAQALSEHSAALAAKGKGGGWAVHSQWDGPPLRQIVSDWKTDTGSVLIGTKSLMTGVDASGETCTLVIIDRPARARANPVDDARVELLMREAQMGKWDADRHVYVVDACLALEQSIGRLIRSVNDSGMVAILDPRLIKTSPFAYPLATQKAYIGTARRFETKVSSRAVALDWLANR